MTNPNVPDIDTQFIIETLIEENRQLNENRLYLLAALKQAKAEFDAEKAEHAAEKESLRKAKSDATVQPAE